MNDNLNATIENNIFNPSRLWNYDYRNKNLVVEHVNPSDEVLDNLGE